MTSSQSRPQRQDTLDAQMHTVMRLAVTHGCYDAHDWLLRNFKTAAQRAAVRGRCPGGHGAACCGFPDVCERALKTGEDR